MDDDIFHLGVVDRPLGLAAPRVLGLGVAFIEADEVDLVEVDELEPARVLDPTAEHQVQLAHSLVRAAPTAACADTLAASDAPSKIERSVSAPFSRVSPSSASRDVPASLAASAAALAVPASLSPTGRSARVSAWVRGRIAARIAPSASPPASAISGASSIASLALQPASATLSRAPS